MRGRGNKGVVTCCRAFLRDRVDLDNFGTGDHHAFARALNRSTKRLHRRCRRGLSWGIARKVLSIFLRDSLYNFYLRKRYALDRAEALLEIPLDSFSAKGVRKYSELSLSEWRGVKHVTPTLNKEYQLAALIVANKKGFARIHLDALFWSLDRDDGQE